MLLSVREYNTASSFWSSAAGAGEPDEGFSNSEMNLFGPRLPRPVLDGAAEITGEKRICINSKGVAVMRGFIIPKPL
jgi:hypothetical protein